MIDSEIVMGAGLKITVAKDEFAASASNKCFKPSEEPRTVGPPCHRATRLEARASGSPVDHEKPDGQERRLGSPSRSGVERSCAPGLRRCR
jgi:hypothetical protein